MCELCDEKDKIILPEFLDNVGSKFVRTKRENRLDIYTESIKSSLTNVNRSFLQIGETLKKIKDEEIWKEKNAHNVEYKSFEQYCSTNFEIAKGQAYRFIKIFDFYTNSDDIVTNRDKYSFSQFQELISISEDDNELLHRITPQMTISAIRRLKHDYYKTKQKQAEYDLAELQPKKEPAKPERPKFEDVYAETLKVIEDAEIKPLVLKNIEERKQFLHTYQEWDLIAVISYLNLKVYRRRLKNQSAIIAFCADVVESGHSYARYSVYIEPENKINYGFRYPSGYFNLYFNSDSEIIDFLTKNKKEIE